MPRDYRRTLTPIWAAVVVALQGGAAVAQTNVSPDRPAAPRVTDDPFEPPNAEGAGASTVKVRAPEFSGKRLWLGTAELMAVQLIPMAFNNAKDLEFAKITPGAWKDNLENPWKWDNNQFVNNQFSHPYHGALYYNAGRANGYNFWASSAWPWIGSLMWEYFGEKWAPSPNDLVNTSLGGITLGETFWRLSSLTLDNRSQGRTRVFRELGAGLLNPVRGFTRLVHGETGRQGENPEEWRPSTLQAALDVGYRRNAATVSTVRESVDQGFVGLSMRYGDVFDDAHKTPFSHFTFRVETARPADVGLQAKRLTTLQSRGSLAAWKLHDGERSHHRFALFITYDYMSNPAYEFGGQGVAGGWIGTPLDNGDVRLTFETLVRTYALAATFSDYFETDEGRNYDYGPGVGASGAVNLSWKGRATVGVSGTTNWIETVSGVDGRHHQSDWSADARFYVSGRFGVGALYRRFDRESRYDAFPTVKFDSDESRVFLSLALPRFGR